MERWMIVGGILVIAVALLVVGCVGSGSRQSDDECQDGVCPQIEATPGEADPCECTLGCRCYPECRCPEPAEPPAPQPPADVTQLELQPLGFVREPRTAPKDAEPPDTDWLV